MNTVIIPFRFTNRMKTDKKHRKKSFISIGRPNNVATCSASRDTRNDLNHHLHRHHHHDLSATQQLEMFKPEVHSSHKVPHAAAADIKINRFVLFLSTNRQALLCVLVICMFVKAFKWNLFKPRSSLCCREMAAASTSRNRFSSGKLELQL